MTPPGPGRPWARCSATLRRHTELLVEHYAAAGRTGPADRATAQDRARAEDRACRDIRKHIAWYLKGYSVGHEVRLGLAHVETLAGLDAVVAGLDADQPYPGDRAEGPRGRTGSSRPVVAARRVAGRPQLDALAAAEVLGAELSVSGG